MLCGISSTQAQTLSEEIKTGALLKRENIDGVDNYAYAAFSFEFGGNGSEAQKLCRNDWDILFGNSPLPDAFDVTTVTDDRSRIKDLGKFTWNDTFHIPRLPAYEEPEREPSVKAVEGHIYLNPPKNTPSTAPAWMEMNLASWALRPRLTVVTKPMNRM